MPRDWEKNSFLQAALVKAFLNEKPNFFPSLSAYVVL
jgi:hypothetical protein